MKSLVVYSSQTGNTRKLAEVVYNTLQGEKEGKPTPPVWVDDAPAAAGHPNDADIEKLKRVVSTLYIIEERRRE